MLYTGWRWCKVVEDRSPLLSNVPQTRRRLQQNKTFKSLSKLIMNSTLRPTLCGWVNNQQQKVKWPREEALDCNWMDITSSKGYLSIKLISTFQLRVTGEQPIFELLTTNFHTVSIVLPQHVERRLKGSYCKKNCNHFTCSMQLRKWANNFKPMHLLLSVILSAQFWIRTHWIFLGFCFTRNYPKCEK